MSYRDQTNGDHYDRGEALDLESVISERRLLISLGYRLLGSSADAEDAVQEAYLRWYRLTEQQQREISSPTGWLIKVVSRICLDMLGSARSRRERYIGQWLPEPIPNPIQWTSHKTADDAFDPADRVTLDESVSMAFLVVLEFMTPAERVAFILHDVFQYSFAEVADILGRSPQACRQLASSARRRVRASRTTITPSDQHAAIVKAFKVAWETGDLTGLLALLAPEATAITDGGGVVSAALEPISGAEAIARFFLGVLDRQPDLTVEEGLVNGHLGLIAHTGGATLAVISIDSAGQLIQHIWAVRNPEKLSAWRQ